ncbi:hypothetical protein ACFYTS_17710 [Nocardia sp. NPDC004151]|uniref:hypothetical protein n=1 Tax=Nocardia sp. NPDC004151 TaxID=3364304 RepID=UPI0036CD4DF1
MGDHAAAADGDLVFVPTLPGVDPRGCALSSIISNKTFLNGIADLIARSGDPEGALARSLRAAAALAGRTDTPMPTRLVLSGHSAGGDAVFHIASQLVSSEVPNTPRLTGLVQLDPVRGIDASVTDDALATLAATDLPIEVVATPASLCNNFGSGVADTRRYLTGRYLGIELTSGSHADALGTGDATVAAAAGLLCGRITAGNVALTREFATAWICDDLTGGVSPEFRPGSADYDALSAAGVLRTVTGM